MGRVGRCDSTGLDWTGRAVVIKKRKINIMENAKGVIY
jgi:hypothetical protein